jgi:hypothetical protein
VSANRAQNANGPDFTIVLSSPSDVEEERRLVKDVVDDLNGWYAPPLGVRLILRRWEDIAPGASERSVQEGIDERLNIPEADLVVAVFQKSLGTPRMKGKTGAEHEIEDALRAWKSRSKPQILVYFDRQPNVSPTVDDTAALLRLLEFKASLQAHGQILLGEYSREKGDFEKKWRRALAEHILAHVGRSPSPPKEVQRWFLAVNKPAKFFTSESRASIMQELRKLTHDSNLVLEGVSDGLVTLVLEGEERGFRSIRNCFMKGEAGALGPSGDMVSIRDVRELDLSFDGMMLPLRVADTHLLQVLVSDFHVGVNGSGAELSLRFDGNTPAIWSRGAKTALKKAIQALPHVWKRRQPYQKNFDKVIFQSGAGCRHFDPDFPFRYANGGVLPVLRLGDQKFYCLFYREVDPIGWNIANGGSDSNDELNDPTQIIERELREELLIVDLTARRRFWLRGRRPGPPPADMPDWIKALRLWKNLLAQHGQPGVDLPNFRLKKANVVWRDGPDCITVDAGDDHPRTFPEVFVTVTTEDQAIEIDRIAEIDFPAGCTVMDGEVYGDRLLNRPVGLFNVKQFQQEPGANAEFFPDLMFHTGREVRAGGRLAEPFTPLTPKFAKNYLSTLQTGNMKWPSEENPFKLCPVTRSVIRRHRRYRESA